MRRPRNRFNFLLFGSIYVIMCSFKRDISFILSHMLIYCCTDIHAFLASDLQFLASLLTHSTDVTFSKCGVKYNNV
uniref:Putative ovule protein n=1 Tax=Solanum chacoense TaxID=4108 RepID=A0A0V0GHR4_SOLCH